MPQIPGLRAVLSLLLTALFVSACNPDNRANVAALESTPLAAGKARLVLYYPDKVIGGDGALKVDFGHDGACLLKSGGYLVRDLPAGENKVAVTFCGMRAASFLKLKADSGAKYYVRVRPYDSSLTGMLSRYPSEYVASAKAAGTHKGPFLIEQMDEPAALAALASLRPAESGGQ